MENLHRPIVYLGACSLFCVLSVCGGCSLDTQADTKIKKYEETWTDEIARGLKVKQVSSAESSWLKLGTREWIDLGDVEIQLQFQAVEKLGYTIDFEGMRSFFELKIPTPGSVDFREIDRWQEIVDLRRGLWTTERFDFLEIAWRIEK